MQIAKERLERVRLMFAEETVHHLQKAHVLIAGCGAVGSMAAEALARSGVGHITLVDFDVYQPSNLNRQLFATVETLGREKVQAARERLLLVAPDIKITVKNVLINAETVESLFDEPIDFAIDAIDSLNPKTLLIETLQKRRIPFISSMGAAMKTDLKLISVGSMKKTIECPLAAFVRKRLRRRAVDLNFPVVWSKECVSDQAHLGEKEDDSPNARHIMGSLMTVTGIFGLMCAHEALLFLTHNEKSFFHGRI